MSEDVQVRDEVDERRFAEADDRKKQVLERYKAFSDGADHLKLSGFEDEDTRRFVTAAHFMNKSRLSTLRPLLPRLLSLKGKPYTLDNYFPFEPFFRTRTPQITLLKTGRQVSKCFWEEEKVRLADGRMLLAKELTVGMVVLALDVSSGTFRPQKITNIWRTGKKAVHRVQTREGLSIRVTEDHRLRARDGDNHIEEFLKVKHLYRGDYLAVMKTDGRLAWEKIQAIHPDGEAETLDIEVEKDHNFLIDRCVSHNSTSLAAQGVVFSNSIPYFSTLYVTPLFEMVRRFSHNYVREFLEGSPMKKLFLGSKTMNSVLQRTFRNGSTMYFSYAFLDAERTRGIPADKNVVDEVQDMNHDFLPIIHETLSGSPYALKQYAGTPKSLDNTMETLWQDSSQAEWVIKCLNPGCGHWNIPAAAWDLMEMIGEWHPNIGEFGRTGKKPGVCCAKCKGPINPRWGHWVHAHPERRWGFAGYHVPQIIMPMHYANPQKWDMLLGKKVGRGNTTMTVFLNEVCGESCDEGSKLVTETDLKQAAILPWRRIWQEACQRIHGYKHRVLAVDWGGGGGRLSSSKNVKGEEKRERTSYTTLAVLGYRPDGKIDGIWGHRSLITHDWVYEARLVLDVMNLFKCSHLVHDYNGSGAGREVLIRQAGLPYENIIPIAYHGAARKGIMQLHPATEDHPRDWYSVDKPRSLALTCACIKHGILRFFQYDYRNADDQGLLRDFLALIDEKVDMRLGSPVHTIHRNPNRPDDFAQAVNIGCCAMWYMEDKWPDLAWAARMELPPEILRNIHPLTRAEWEDI